MDPRKEAPIVSWHTAGPAVKPGARKPPAKRRSTMVSFTGKFVGAAVQAEPVWLNADATIDKSIAIIEEAARTGAELIAFPEVFIPGCPYWSWIGDQKWGFKYLVGYHENSLEPGDDRMRRLQVAARQNNVAAVMGYSERDGAGRYISQVFIDQRGEIVANRRKLKPTHVERTIYGEGDGSDFLAHDFSFGRVGGLNCWEHFQPLSKYMMYSLGSRSTLPPGRPCSPSNPTSSS
jgi:predicted amidohydrolase